jgi:hypothetical protein
MIASWSRSGPWVLAFISTMLSVSACQKAPLDTLPEATQTGARTMGCLIDGNAFQPKNLILFGPEPMGASRSSDGEMSFRFSRNGLEDDQGQMLRLVLPRVRGVGLYRLQQDSPPLLPGGPPFPTAAGSYGHSLPKGTNPMAPFREYRTGALAGGQVLITRFDSVEKTISGTFEFTAREVNGTGTVRVTQGRFDMPYNRR